MPLGGVLVEKIPTRADRLVGYGLGQR